MVLLSIFTLGLIDAIVKKRFSLINRKIVECESDMFAKEEFSHAAFEEADEKIASYVKLDSFATFLKGLISVYRYFIDITLSLTIPRSSSSVVF